MIAFGADNNYLTQGPALRPEEAWNIETKIDDGRPAFGRVVAFKQGTSVTPNCTTTAVDATAEYAVSNTSIACSLNFGL